MNALELNAGAQCPAYKDWLNFQAEARNIYLGLMGQLNEGQRLWDQVVAQLRAKGQQKLLDEMTHASTSMVQMKESVSPADGFQQSLARLRKQIQQVHSVLSGPLLTWSQTWSQVYERQTNAVGITFSKDERMLFTITKSTDKQLMAWDLHSGRLLYSEPFSRDRWVAAGGNYVAIQDGNQIRIMDPYTRTLRQTIEVGAKVRGIFLLSNSLGVVYKDSVDIYDLQGSRVALSLGGVYHVNYHHIGPFLALVTTDKVDSRTCVIIVYDSENKRTIFKQEQELVKIGPVFSKTKYIPSPLISPNGKTLLLLVTPEQFWVWHIGTGDVLHQISAQKLKHVCLSADGEAFAWGSEGVVNVQRNVMGKTEAMSIKIQRSGQLRLGFSPDAQLLGISVDSNLYVWDITENREIFQAGFNEPILSFSFSSTGRFLAVGGRTKIWLFRGDYAGLHPAILECWQSLQEIEFWYLQNLMELGWNCTEKAKPFEEQGYAVQPWNTDAWQKWEPGTLKAGVVRLGAFRLLKCEMKDSTHEPPDGFACATARLYGSTAGSSEQT